MGRHPSSYFISFTRKGTLRSRSLPNFKNRKRVVYLYRRLVANAVKTLSQSQQLLKRLKVQQFSKAEITSLMKRMSKSKKSEMKRVKTKELITVLQPM